MTPFHHTRRPLAQPRSWEPVLVPAAPPQETKHRILAMDLGQSRDYCAAAMYQWHTYDRAWTGERKDRIDVLLRRWPLTTVYTQVCRDALDTRGLEAILVEFNGPGGPVVDILRQQAAQRQWKGRIQPVYTAGSQAAGARKTGDKWVVPKKDMITALQVLGEQTGRMRFPGKENAAMARVLFEEMRTFEYRMSKSGNTQYGNVAGVGNHDDVVMSAAIGAWWIWKGVGTKKLAISV